MKGLLLCLLVLSTSAFAPHPHVQTLNSVLSARKKGFGKAEAPGSAQPKEPQPSTENSASPLTTDGQPTLNEGQKALQQLRRERAEKKDAELRQIREMVKADQQMSTQGAAIPEQVAQRMGKRMLPFVGLPLLGGMGSFVAFWYLATYKNMEFQPAVVAGSTIGILAISLLGITYSVMSTSWDVDREGSFLGTEEFQKNLQNTKDGLQRSRENAILRDRLASIGKDELKQALEDLDRRDAANDKKTRSLSNKLDQEMS